MDSYFPIELMDGHGESEDICEQELSADIPKKHVHIFSHSKSTISTKDLIKSDSSDGRIFKRSLFRKMTQNASRKAIMAVLFILFAATLTMTTLYILEHKRNLSIVISTSTRKDVECLEHVPDVTLKSIPPEVQAALPLLEKEIKSHSAASKAASFGIVYNGTLWWSYHIGRMNYRDPKSPPPNDDTPYPVASVTKLFTAVMLHKLVQDGTIKSVDDPVKLYNSKFSIKNPFNNEDITFRQLMCMTSGLPREAPCYPDETYNLCPYNNSEMWRRIAETSLAMRPNELPSYSNLGYAILGRIMANVTKERNYEKWIKKEILDRIGMNNSGFDIRQKYSAMPLSTNHDLSEARIMDWGWLNPASGMYSTINDLHKFVSLLTVSSDSKVLSLSSKRQVFQIDRLYQRTSNYVAFGCPFVVKKRETAEKDVSNNVKKKIYQKLFSRNGNTFGYYSNIVFSPDLKFAAIALTANGVSLGDIVADRIVPILDKIVRRNGAKYKLPPNPDSYVGTYKVISYWPMISRPALITYENGKLFIGIETFKAALTYVRPWVLKTMYDENRDVVARCKDELTSSGLYNDLYHFERPRNGTSNCASFYIDGISANGRTSFKRI